MKKKTKYCAAPPLVGFIKRRMQLDPQEEESQGALESEEEEASEETEEVEEESQETDEDRLIDFDELDNLGEQTEESESEEEGEEEEEEEQTEETEEQQQQPKSKRNYERFDELSEDELKQVKDLHTGAFKRVEPILLKLNQDRKEWKAAQAKVTELEEYQGGSVPQSFYQHPDAYQLSPKYQQLSSRYQTIDFETNYYKQQAVALERGESVKLIEGYDSKTGDPIYSDELEGPEARAELQGVFTNLAVAKRETGDQLTSLRDSYGKNYKEATQLVEHIGQELMSRLPEQSRPSTEDINSIKRDLLPESFQDHPLANMLAGAVKVIGLVSGQAAQLKKQLDEQQKLRNDETLAGVKPGKVKKSSAPRKADDDFIPWDELDAEMAE